MSNLSAFVQITFREDITYHNPGSFTFLLKQTEFSVFLVKTRWYCELYDTFTLSISDSEKNVYAYCFRSFNGVWLWKMFLRIFFLTNYIDILLNVCIKFSYSYFLIHHYQKRALNECSVIWMLNISVRSIWVFHNTFGIIEETNSDQKNNIMIDNKSELCLQKLYLYLVIL